MVASTPWPKLKRAATSTSSCPRHCRHQVRVLPLVSISVAVVTNRFRQFASIEALSEEAARLKKRCKKIKGSSYVDDSDLAMSKVSH